LLVRRNKSQPASWERSNFVLLLPEHIFQEFQVLGIIIHDHNVAVRRRMVGYRRQAFSSKLRFSTSYSYLSAKDERFLSRGDPTLFSEWPLARLRRSYAYLSRISRGLHSFQKAYGCLSVIANCRGKAGEPHLEPTIGCPIPESTTSLPSQMVPETQMKGTEGLPGTILRAEKPSKQ
jgi:hypothetical protein